MALDSLTQLDKHKAQPFTVGTPATVRTFYSPIDDVHGVLLDLIQSARHSLVVGMYGFDDKELSDAIQERLLSQNCYVQMSLDASQAAGKAERDILATWQHDLIGNSISIGHSEKGAITHVKMLVVDGIDVVTGSTNWSIGGESKQDNQCTVIRDAIIAAEARARLDRVHDAQLKQLAAKRAA